MSYAHLGGLENAGTQGGYRNYRVKFARLMEYETVQRWLRRRADITRGEYLYRFEKFLAWTKAEIRVQDPDQFLKWARRQKSGVIVQDLIDKYTETLSKAQAHAYTAVVRGFLTRNGYRELPKIDWESTISMTEGYTREQVQQLLSYLDNPLQKLYVLFAKDTGLRANDLLYLRYKHLKADYEDKKEFVHIRFEDERYRRRKAPGLVFIGPASITLLQQLINSGVVKREPEAKIFPFAYRTITFELTKAKKLANLDPKLQPNHGLRKFYDNCLSRVGMDAHKKMQLMGHSLKVEGAYISREVETLRGLYQQAYQYLDLSENAVAKDLETKYAEALTKIGKLEERGQEEKTALLRRIENLEGLVQAPQFTQTLPDEVYDELAKQAEKRGITLQEMVYYVVDEWMAEYEKAKKKKSS